MWKQACTKCRRESVNVREMDVQIICMLKTTDFNWISFLQDFTKTKGFHSERALHFYMLCTDNN